MNIRKNFIDKYERLSIDWNIDEQMVYYIIRRYEKLLLNEIEKLKSGNLKLPKYFKDIRTDDEYIYDIIDGWLIEDIICDAWFRNRILKSLPNAEIKIMGTNRDRIIQTYDSSKISTKPDFIFSNGLEDIRIELQMARKELPYGYDMKETKVQRAINENNLFLWIIIPSNSFFIIDPNKDLKGIIPKPNPYWGNKLVYHFDISLIKTFGGSYFLKDDLPLIYQNKLRLKNHE